MSLLTHNYFRFGLQRFLSHDSRGKQSGPGTPAESFGGGRQSVSRGAGGKFRGRVLTRRGLPTSGRGCAVKGQNVNAVKTVEDSFGRD